LRLKPNIQKSRSIVSVILHLVFLEEFPHPLSFAAPRDVADVETVVMLSVLGLIDVVMIANLLIMVIVGGYETFVSRLNLHNHPDQPEWLSHVNAGILKVKLATALIGISSIHLLKTFINAAKIDSKTILWQVVIHVTFVPSPFALAWIDRLTFRAAHLTDEENGHGRAGKIFLTPNARWNRKRLAGDPKRRQSRTHSQDASARFHGPLVIAVTNATKLASAQIRRLQVLASHRRSSSRRVRFVPIVVTSVRRR
jgi:uncharacterized protein (TIGR00645 family)